MGMKPSELSPKRVSAWKRPPRFEVDALVVAHTQIVGNEFEIIFHAPQIAQVAHPGQFLELLYNDSYAPLIRRPFSLYRVDREAGTCSVLYLARGSFTSGLARKRIGDTVSLLGPLGKPFIWSEEQDAAHILIAGGIGAPPLYFLAREISRAQAVQGRDSHNVIVINAARTQDLLVGMTHFGALNVLVHAMTDDGSHGRQGVATDLLKPLLDELASRARSEETLTPEDFRSGQTSSVFLYTCGPMPMLRAIGDIAIARNLPCQISIETSMPCGIGTCYACAIPVHDKTTPDGIRQVRACWDGPVFEARELVWGR